MQRAIRVFVMTCVGLVMLAGSSFASSGDERSELLKVREAVWRAWFANDVTTLKELVPSDTIAISTGEETWQDQAHILQEAANFQTSGAKLIRLEFPRTEVQQFGDVAVTYSLYVYETEAGGKRSVSSGRVTEVFVRRNGKWTNPGWHTDSEK